MVRRREEREEKEEMSTNSTPCLENSMWRFLVAYLQPPALTNPTRVKKNAIYEKLKNAR